MYFFDYVYFQAMEPIFIEISIWKQTNKKTLN